MLRIIPALVLAITVALGVACGSDSDSDGDLSPAAETTAPGATDGGNGTGATASGTAEPLTFADYLAVGDCFNDVFDDEGDYDYDTPPPIVDCEEPHDNEAYLFFEYPSDLSDEEEIDDFIGSACDEGFYEYVGNEGRALSWFWVEPEEEEREQGAKNVVCSIFLPDGELAGSMEGQALTVLPASFPEGVPFPEEQVLDRVGSTDNGAPAPPDFVIEESGFDGDGLFLASFDYTGSGGLTEAKAAMESAIADSGWTIVYQYGDDTTLYAVEKGGREMILSVNDLDPPAYGYYYHR